MLLGLLTAAESEALRLSLVVAGGCVLAIAVPAVLLGYVLARWRFPGRSLLDAVVHLPLVLPPVVTGYLLLLVMGRNGLLGRWLWEQFGVQLPFSTAGAVLASAVVALPLMVRSVRLSMELVDTQLEQAAATLGCSPLRTFCTVTLPLAAPGILAGGILAFARSLGEFGATISFAGNIAGRTRTLPLAIYNRISTPGGESAAMRLAMVSVVLSVAALLVSELLARRIRRKLGATG
ncbi:MAG: molybdate ABC transporter permease subunit [Phycisphaerae bacterium]